jgi:hypothetical protein
VTINVDWLGLAVGAIIGAIAGLVIQNIAFPSFHRRFASWRKQRFYKAARIAWAAVERSRSGLHLFQAGWGEDGYFASGTTSLVLEGEFHLKDAALVQLRDAHTKGWLAHGMTDDEQVGVSAIRISRLNDKPDDEKSGRNHELRLTVHTYRYFDHQATHRLRLDGTGEERAILDAIVGRPVSDVPVSSFPNPCSVGLSLFCEEGDYLALPRRSMQISAGGHSWGGQIYNIVGENAAPWDFFNALDGSRRTTPDTIARRGLHQEAGFSDDDIFECLKFGIHSFAWASDLLDYKFFGLAITSLSRGEVEDRWRHAPDHKESMGTTLPFELVRSRGDCRRLLRSLKEKPDDWAPEAVFSTIRSLIVLRRVRPADIATVFRER